MPFAMFAATGSPAFDGMDPTQILRERLQAVAAASMKPVHRPWHGTSIGTPLTASNLSIKLMGIEKIVLRSPKVERQVHVNAA